MFDLAQLVFQGLSVVLFVFLCWQPRYPVFMGAVLAGIGRSFYVDTPDPSVYMAWDAPTTALRLLACLEAFLRRTEDLTRRRTLFLLSAAVGALAISLLFGFTVRSSPIDWYNRLTMLGCIGGAAFLLPMSLYGLFLETVYRRDQIHLHLLALLCFVLGGAETLGVTTANQWIGITGWAYWLTNLLLMAWLVGFGHPLIARELVKATRERIRLRT